MEVADLVRHSEDHWLGLGLVTEIRGVHCTVQWTYEADDDRKNPGPTLEANSMLEIINESR